jgi:hypothetical protein
MCYIADAEIGQLPRGAEVSIRPDRRIDESGVLVLSHDQGLLLTVTDGGSLAEGVIEDYTGLLFRSGDVPDLARRVNPQPACDGYRHLLAAGPAYRAAA